MAQPSTVALTRDVFDKLKAGDRIEVNHEVKVGNKRWHTITEGTVDRIERRRHGLHFRRNPDDKVYSDLIMIRLDDGEMTTVTLDEFTVVKKL